MSPGGTSGSHASSADQHHDGRADRVGQRGPGGVQLILVGVAGARARGATPNSFRVGGSAGGSARRAQTPSVDARRCAMWGRLSRGGRAGNHGEGRLLCAAVRVFACLCVNAGGYAQAARSRMPRPPSRQSRRFQVLKLQTVTTRTPCEDPPPDPQVIRDICPTDSTDPDQAAWLAARARLPEVVRDGLQRWDQLPRAVQAAVEALFKAVR
jgi:hypothetical protein